MSLKTTKIVLVLLVSLSANCVEFTVNSTDDLIDINPGDGVCEATAANGDCTLRAAIMETNALVSNDHINLPIGVFTLSLVGDDVAAQIGDLDVISNNLVIEGVSRDESIIDGGGIDRIFEFIESTITLEKLTLRNGGDKLATVLGGAIFASGTDVDTLSINNVKFDDNRANAGGAIFAASSINVLINNSELINNTTVPLGITNTYGSAIFCSGCDIKIDSSSIIYNNFGSKAIRVEGGHLDMINSTVSNNNEGGIRTVNADALIKFSTIVDNVYQNLSHFSFDDTKFLQIESSVLQTNTSNNCQSGDLPISLGNNIVNDNSCNFVELGDMENTDAQLDILKYNGGNTMTHRPKVSSVLIDNVNIVDCNDLQNNPLLLDQRGGQRPNGVSCDIGAVEANSDIIYFNGFD